MFENPFIAAVSVALGIGIVIVTWCVITIVSLISESSRQKEEIKGIKTSLEKCTCKH